MSSEGSHPRSEPVVHVRGDSDTYLEDLFKVLDDPNKIQKPFKNRDLPSSFFNPPGPRSGNHSRESSKDGGSFAPGATVTGLPIAHQRSQSSPAQLPHSLSVPPSVQPQHMKQASLGDYTDDSLAPLPPGWQMAKTADGQRYYLNHLDQTTSWADPRKSLSTTALNQMKHIGHPGQPPSPLAPLSPNQSLSPGSLSPSVSLQNLPPLPVGWEQAITPAGEVYFINHNERTTSWFDPRLRKYDETRNRQKAGMKKDELLRHHMMVAQAQAGSPSPTHSPSPQPPPPAVSTSPQHLPPPPGPPCSDPTSIHLKMQMLEQENELLRKRQQEMLRQMTNLSVQKNAVGEDILLISGSTAMTSQTMSPSLGGMTNQSGDITMTTSGIDPFLSQADPITTTSESHARQNSADSGLGGMGTSYSLPRTPEDLLGNVDEMDTQESGPKMPQTDFNLNDLASSNMEVGNIGENSNDGTAMDSDDLVPSIDSVDLFNGVDVHKMESLLTWL